MIDMKDATYYRMRSWVGGAACYADCGENHCALTAAMVDNHVKLLTHDDLRIIYPNEMTTYNARVGYAHCSDDISRMIFVRDNGTEVNFTVRINGFVTLYQTIVYSTAPSGWTPRYYKSEWRVAVLGREPVITEYTPTDIEFGVYWEDDQWWICFKSSEDLLEWRLKQ